ncbi:hypothetical protein [Butyrivibrio sp. AC2005]|uniref:hypothetical protein n=1 Tax=Butyrivibrio sp. AC2005 TaxID=1280672 RepID=UPI00047ADBE1|nr:hypothetical protein [Butyrivibrio sp. AC2005]
MNTDKNFDIILDNMELGSKVLHVPFSRDIVEFKDNLPSFEGGFFNQKTKTIEVSINQDLSIMLFNAIHELWHYAADYKGMSKSTSTKDPIMDYDEIMADAFAHTFLSFLYMDQDALYLQNLKLKYTHDKGARRKAIDKMYFLYSLRLFFYSHCRHITSL